VFFLRFRSLGQRKARYFWKFAAMEGIQTGREGEGNKPGPHHEKSRLRTQITGRTARTPFAVCDSRQEDYASAGCRFLFAASILLFLSLSSGCGSKFFDPTQVGRFRPVPAVNVILDSLGVAEEAPVAWEDAKEPLAIDTVAMESDYAFRAGDIISVAIFELLQEGIQFVNNYVVTETGRISIPEVGVVKAAGLTETQLEEEIKQILSPSILKNPSVIVTLAGSQQRAFSILGDGVPLPGRYSIPRYDFRLTDALATAGGPRQFNVSYIYISRFVGDKRNKGYEPFKQGFDGLELEVIEPETTRISHNIQQTARPRREYQWPASKVVISSSEMVSDWEAAGIPKAFEWPSNRTPSRINTQGTRKSSTMLAAPETTDEPIGVKDILNTLDERSRREQKWLNGQVNVENALETFRELVRVEERVDERINHRDTLTSSPVPVAPKPISEPLDKEEPGRIKWIFQNGKWISIPDETGLPKPTEEKEQTGHIEWIFRNGKWVPVQVGAPQPPTPIEPVRPDIKIEPGEKPFGPFEEQVPAGLERGPGAGTRLIRIPADKLLAGDSRYNIVIKPGDTIHVPVDIIGEFCIMGNVNRTGYIPITGRPMTLKMAIAAAGGLGPLAWPRRCEVVRRIGRKKEEIVMVDLDKITSGEQPDFFIKPNDLINVGTHPTSRWRAILRNAFRATYGFGFVYDRNFADRDFYTSRPFPSWL
jgi:protein involved in polysaccharide export with SLBB domain